MWLFSQWEVNTVRITYYPNCVLITYYEHAWLPSQSLQRPALEQGKLNKSVVDSYYAVL